jgi:hypothetical protein
MANMWNSEDFNPVAPASEYHFDFLNAIDCTLEQVAGLAPATSQKIDDIVVSMRSDRFVSSQGGSKAGKVKVEGIHKKRRQWMWLTTTNPATPLRLMMKILDKERILVG